MSLERECTVTVHLRYEESAEIKRKEVVGLCKKRNVLENIRCIQEVGNYFRVTFDSEEAKGKFLSKAFHDFDCRPIDNSKLVRVSGLPFEVPDTDLRAVLGGFGDIVSSEMEMDKEDGYPTGTRLLRLRVKTHLPNRMFCLGYPFRVWYPGQPKQCHHCLSRDHLVAQCPERGLCRTCRKPGHMAKVCPQRKTGNTGAFSWGSQPPVDSQSVEAGDVEVDASSQTPPSGRESENPAEEEDEVFIDAEPDPPAPIRVEVLDEGGAPALVDPPDRQAIVETASSTDSAPAKHSSPGIGAAADLVALEFSRSRQRITGSMKAKSKIKPKR